MRGHKYLEEGGAERILGNVLPCFAGDDSADDGLGDNDRKEKALYLFVCEIGLRQFAD